MSIFIIIIVCKSNNRKYNKDFNCYIYNKNIIDHIFLI